ncbi:hypothetical protein [Prescottella subtropica]|uniref:hypothetical protein n=1 Tax=Prescottella subtropica TaxID=2545757 RepID=UPI0010F9EC7A|nr:hypothetical protein [Prescottella subtropica]
MTGGPGPDGDGDGDLSLAKLALATMGTGATILIVAAVLVVALRPGPIPGLVIALAGIVAAIAAMGAVSKRMTRRAFGDRGRDG